MKTTSTTSKTLRLYWQQVRRYPRYVGGIAASVPLTILVYQFIPPLILANVLNRLSKGQFVQHDIVGSFGPQLIWYGFLMLFGGVVAWRVVDHFVWKLEANVERDIARKVFNHMLEQDANFHANHFGGSLVSQTNKLLGSYTRFADTTVFQVYPMLVSIVLTVVILGRRAPLFVALFIAFSVFYIASSFVATRDVRRLSGEHAAAESKQTGYLADNITNIMAVKSFAGSSFENQRFAGITNFSRERKLALMRASQKQMVYYSAISGVISALSLTMAVIGVMVFKASIGTVFLIFNYTTLVVRQLWEFGTTSLRNYNRSIGDAYEMVEILQIVPAVQEALKPERTRIHRGLIEFKAVSFAHEDAGEALFNKLSLRIKPGEKIGLVGHSGSGKTTFTRLLLRFSDIDGGEIAIDGQNIAHITQDDLHQHIAYVPQEPIMFHRSLADNIRYGFFKATDNEVLEASKAAHAHEFIEKLPQGYETLVGERGVKLSGGQRQRVAIARAMLKNAPILVLDEATSALDSESELLIQQALWKLMEGRTAIVIAHRLSTVQKMDRIVVLEDGAVVEEGTHKELLAEEGVYASLWAHQSGGFLDE